MRAKVFRYWRNSEEWDVAVYWTHDPDKCPHDYDLFMEPKEWRRFSGLASPKGDQGFEIEISVMKLVKGLKALATENE